MPKVIHVVTVDLTVRLLLHPLLCHLETAGYKVGVACKFEQWLTNINLGGIAQWNIRYFNRQLSPLHDLLALLELYSLFRRERPDIVHTHTPKANLLGRIAARLAGVPIVIGMEHGFYFLNMKGFVRTFHVLLCRFAAFLSDKTIVLTQYDFDLALHERISKRSALILAPAGLGVDLTRFQRSLPSTTLKMELNVNEDFAIIIFIGRLNSEKGCLELIRAARRINLTFQNFHLLMVGPSENGMKEDLEELAASLNLEKRVSLLGERQDIPQLLAFSDILVLPSYREGLGMVLLEAAAAGRPAVTSNIRGCRDVVVDGKTGLLVTPGSVQELADAVLDLLQNVGKRKRMGEAARQHAEKKFDQTYFFTQIDNLYRQLLKEKGLC